jgi:hypothetical protein
MIPAKTNGRPCGSVAFTFAPPAPRKLLSVKAAVTRTPLRPFWRSPLGGTIRAVNPSPRRS